MEKRAELLRFNMFDPGTMEEVGAIGYAWTKKVLISLR